MVSGFAARASTLGVLEYVEITKSRDWPGAENVALSTIHSAKGLDFDHVIIIGLDNSAPSGRRRGTWRRPLRPCLSPYFYGNRARQNGRRALLMTPAGSLQ
ncbi:3'-5' exonuclease [Rhodoferax sp.]|uniref:3'-5' exonuclease n=1 Tax=Rhodoferax sp. TaxID=50421 RepID=UPI003A0FCB7A